MSYSDLLRGTIVPSGDPNIFKQLPTQPSPGPQDDRGITSRYTEYSNPKSLPSLTQWGEEPVSHWSGFSSPRGGKKWYRDYRDWGKYLGGSAEKSMIGGAYGQAWDPMMLLQGQLVGAIGAPAGATEGDVRANVGSQIGRNQQQLRSYGMSLGAPDAMQGMIGAQAKLRQTMADRAVAQYMPQAWAQNESFQNEIGNVLSALSRADYETTAALKTTGRSV